MSLPLCPDLLALQRALDTAEAEWRTCVVELHQHPDLMRARAEGRLPEALDRVRAAARAA